ncbi:MAG: hypothetical protein R3F37_00230 [Candidatus Competibacteraceae bacterium]
MPKRHQSLRKTTIKKTKQSLSDKYKKKTKVGKRTTRKPVAFCPGKAAGQYLKPWLIPRAQQLRKKIEANRTKKLVEEYGETGAKWHLARNILNQNIDDASPAGSFQVGKFVTFSGANTADIIYVDTNANPNVYVLEAKGGLATLSSKGRKGKYPPNQGKKLNQGDWNYLEDVANAMINSTSPDKQAAGTAILNAYQQNNGKLHYIGVSTKLSKLGAPLPSELFNKTR